MLGSNDVGLVLQSPPRHEFSIPTQRIGHVTSSHRVALLARSAASIESLANEIGGLAVPCNVADEAAVRQAVHKSAAEFGGIGIVINNAGTLALLGEKPCCRLAYASTNQGFHIFLNPIGAILTRDRVLAYPHPSVLVDQPSAGGLDVYTFVGCHLTLSWELFATPVFGPILNFFMNS